MVREELWDGALALIGGMLAFGVYSIVEDAAAWMRRREFSRQCRRGASPLERKRLSIEPSHRRRVTIIRQMMCLCDDTKRTEPERVSQALQRVHSGVSKLPGPHKIRNCRRIADRVLISTTPTGESEPSTSPNFPPTLIFARDSRAPWRPHEALACICASWPLVGKGTHEGRERARTGGMNLQCSAQMS